jgi:hypothetical protein
MKTIDLTPELERKKGATIQRTTLYMKLPYIAFYHHNMGVAFLRVIKKNTKVKLEKSGRVKWYHTIDGDLRHAIIYARKIYGIKLPIKGWEKMKVRHYNISEVEDMVLAILKLT